MIEDLSSATITDGLQTKFVGQRVVYYPSLTSTMDVARREARQGAAEGTVVIAEEQKAGRGRMGRAWVMPRGNVALSVVLHPSLSDLPSLIMLASLGVTHAIKVATNLKAGIKWPNDVQINGKKVCGILIESDLQGSRVNYSIIGIGINVNLRLSGFPELKPIATSLSDEVGTEVSRLSVVQTLLVEMEQLYLSLRGGGSLYEEWRDNLMTMGKKVRAKTGDTVYEGIAESVEQDGSLMLRGQDGKLTRFVAGDVTLRE